MTDGRITQAGLLTLGSGDPDARATQAELLVLGQGLPSGRATQTQLLVLADLLPPLAPIAGDFEVLEKNPNRDLDQEEVVARSFALLDTGLGLRTADVREAAPRPERPFQWWCTTRAEVAELRAFLARRRGRVVPFWLPSWEDSLALAQDSAASSTTVLIQSSRYTAEMFPQTARRRVRFRLLGGPGTVQDRTITASVDNGNGTETLTLNTPLTAEVTVARTRIEFLRFVRLDEDEVRIEWLRSHHVARATIPVRELPREVPL